MSRRDLCISAQINIEPIQFPSQAYQTDLNSALKQSIDCKNYFNFQFKTNLDWSLSVTVNENWTE